MSNSDRGGPNMSQYLPKRTKGIPPVSAVLKKRREALAKTQSSALAASQISIVAKGGVSLLQRKPKPITAPANAMAIHMARAASATTAKGLTKNAPDAKLNPEMPIRRRRKPIQRAAIDLDQPGYLRLQDVLAIFPVSRASWYAGIKSGKYPKSFPLGPRAVGWSTASVKKLLEDPPDYKLIRSPRSR